MAKTYQTVIIDGKKYMREIDTRDEQARRFMASDQAQSSLGLRLDSYAASTFGNRKGKMSVANKVHSAIQEKRIMAIVSKSDSDIIRSK